MKERGEYTYVLDHTFADRFRNNIEAAQNLLRENVTGCLTWSVVAEYDPLKRRPPEQ